jgi:hypothetical protein
VSLDHPNLGLGTSTGFVAGFVAVWLDLGRGGRRNPGWQPRGQMVDALTRVAPSRRLGPPSPVCAGHRLATSPTEQIVKLLDGDRFPGVVWDRRKRVTPVAFDHQQHQLGYAQRVHPEVASDSHMRTHLRRGDTSKLCQLL